MLLGSAQEPLGILELLKQIAPGVTRAAVLRDPAMTGGIGQYGAIQNAAPPAVHPNIGYDPVKVFTPVCLLIETPLIVAAHQDLPVKSLAEVVAYAKANPGKISWGSQGFGVAPHLLLELFKLEAGI